MSNGRARYLTPADADEILRLADIEGLNHEILARELAAGEDYLWMGLVKPTGELGAVHRSMRWGRHLLLKGVFVEEAWRGAGAALELAFALRDSARDAGFAGVVAWVEPHKPEAGLAHLLRLRQAGPMLHRFEVPIAGSEAEQATSVSAVPASANSGMFTLTLARTGSMPPAAGDLLDDTQGSHHDANMANALAPGSEQIPVAIRWVLDRHRLVLSAFPCRSVADLAELTATIRIFTGPSAARALEVAVPAADISVALSLAGIKARRLSRTPVRLGRLDFDHHPRKNY